MRATDSNSAFAMYRALVGTGCVCALLVVFTYLLTAPLIAQKRSAALHEAVFAVLPGTTATLALHANDQGELGLLEHGAATPMYLGLDAGGRITGLAISAQGMGYQDLIRLLYGYAPDRGRVIGLKVLDSRETPGLGDRIHHDRAFLAAFEDLQIPLSADDGRVQQPITIRSGPHRQPWQFDAITGATISSQAVARILSQSSALWAPLIWRNQETLQGIASRAEGARHGP